MKVKCVSKKGVDLSVDAINVGYLHSSFFPLEVGSTYSVYGMCIWKKILHYLLFNPDYHLPYPEWFPAELFSVEDSLLPYEWYYQFIGYGETNLLIAIWGYREMIECPEHYDKLIDHDGNAIDIFLSRRREIDEQLGYA